MGSLEPLREKIGGSLEKGMSHGAHGGSQDGKGPGDGMDGMAGMDDSSGHGGHDDGKR